MKLSDFDYELPRELIAQYPPVVRGASRLLVAHRSTGRIEHRQFADIAQYLSAGDALIVNDTRVVPCRLLGRRASGGKVEVFLLRRIGESVFAAFIKPARLRNGEVVVFEHGLRGEILDRNTIRFDSSDQERIYRSGCVPLPPYIKRPAEELDEERYQTVYAASPGAVAAPTAGLHFTAGLLDRIRASGVRTGTLTLHTGAGTFRPVSAGDVETHIMEAERFSIPRGTQELIERTRAHEGRIFVAGTTAVRALETFAREHRPEGETTLFIRGSHRFLLCDALITNFHLPRTTLLVLVHAFAGRDLARRAYEEAIARSYRFYSYGDAMLIL